MLTYSFIYNQPVHYVSASFLEFMKWEIVSPQLRLSTQKNHRSTWKLLRAFRSEILFTDIDYDFLRHFEAFLLGRNYRCNTVAKHLRHLKRYINLAINKGLMDLGAYPFRNYKIKLQETSRIYLTPGELSRLEHCHVKSCAQRRVLDMFLFSCYTGLRYSDIVRLEQGHFQWINRELWLIYSMQKTERTVRLPLNLLFGGRAVRIYDRYSRFCRQTLFGISPSSNSSVNKILKTICKTLRIGKSVSFHVARHIISYYSLKTRNLQRLSA